MNQAINYAVGYGLPLSMAVLVLVGLVLSMGVALAWPRLIVLGYVAVLAIFPMSSSYGLEDPTEASIVYVKGTKTFFFSFLDMMIFGTWLMVVVYARLLQKNRETLGPLMKFYICFGVLFLGYVVVGLADSSHPSLLDFYGRGVINVLWQGMFIALLLATIRTERDLKFLVVIVLVCIAGREIFGAVRYLFLGGDPQNAYANLENLKIKITFWDINDSVLAIFALGYCVWQLLAGQRLKLEAWLGYAGFSLMAALTVLLSARRTAQAGLLLALVAVAWLLPKGRRWPIVLTLALLTPIALVVTSARTEGAASITQKILIDIKLDSNADPRRGRFYELTTAWATVRENPVFGVGPTGSFKVWSPIGLQYHRGQYDFVHSGFGHILLKTGFVGLFIFLGIFVSYLRFLRRNWASLSPPKRALVAASIAAFVAQMPNMMFGTPIGEIRTMMVLGLIFALPFLVVRAREVAPDAAVRPRPGARRTTLGSFAGSRV